MFNRHQDPRTAAGRLASAAGFVALALALAMAWPLAAAALSLTGDDAVTDAREALRKNDKVRLAALREVVRQARHPLAGWVDYWELSNRLGEAQQAELDAFYARWPATYVEDRLRNDWLLELGRRRDWDNFNREFPRFRMNDDREVTCYALLNRHFAGQDVREPARATWFAQRDLDDGCNLMATTLVEAGRLGADDIWREARLSVELNRVRAARAAVTLVSPAAVAAVSELFDNPARYLNKHREPRSALQKELALLAVGRLAAKDPEAAAAALQSRVQRQIGGERAAWAWALVGKHAAIKLLPEASSYSQRAWKLQTGLRQAPDWSDEVLGWQVRAAVRSDRIDTERWQLVGRAIDAMGAAERNESGWVYWRARARQALAKSGAEGDADRLAAEQALRGLAGGLNFYAKLANEELGLALKLPAPPSAVSETELASAAALPGLRRAMAMADLGLRDEARREWNFTLRGMGDRELLAAAQLACNAADWQLCINTSERTKQEVDIRQRYPLPFREQIAERANERSLDPAFVYGLIRQETRFMATLRSHAGASGLMQLMPATARWTARRLGLDFKPSAIDDIDTNLRLGTAYLKTVMDDFGGSQALAAAAYNAGPGRPRRWRDGPVLEPAAWAENIPFNETRDYVKKVLFNAVVYSALIGGGTPSLKMRLGPSIGPRDPNAPSGDREIP